MKVGENDVLNLIELLMAQLIKLDGIAADGEAKQQRGMQVEFTTLSLIWISMFSNTMLFAGEKSSEVC